MGISFIRRSSQDVSKIAGIIPALRETQRVYEQDYLDHVDASQRAYAALHLASLYHWAKTTEVLATYMLQATSADVDTIIDFHYDKAFVASEASETFEIGNL